MSVGTTRSLICEGCLCMEDFGLDQPATAKALRQAARRPAWGWRRTKDGRDICSTCVDWEENGPPNTIVITSEQRCRLWPLPGDTDSGTAKDVVRLHLGVWCQEGYDEDVVKAQEYAAEQWGSAAMVHVSLASSSRNWGQGYRDYRVLQAAAARVRETEPDAICLDGMTENEVK